jgi:hypothetical protein
MTPTLATLQTTIALGLLAILLLPVCIGLAYYLRGKR